MKTRCAVAAGLVLAMAGPSPAMADVSFHGFGQVVAGTTLSNDHAISSVSVGEASNSYSADLSFQPESLFALQVQAPLTSSVTATAQIVASGGDNNDFQPTFEWAYLSYALGDHWLIKAGRQRIPLYRYSECLEVGEAYPWLRPPIAVYQGFISNFDGVSATGYYEIGRWALQSEVGYGDFNRSLTQSGSTATIQLDNATGASFTASFDRWLDLRAAFIYSEGSIADSELDPLVDEALPQSVEFTPTPVPANNSRVINDLSPNRHSVSFYTVGFSLHPGLWRFESEVDGTRYDDTVAERARDYYFSAGYRFGRLTPMLTGGRSDLASSDPGILGDVAPNSQCPVGVDPSTGQPIFKSCSSLVAQVIDSQIQPADYYEAGARYDLTDNTALKVDWTRMLSHQQPGDGPAGASHSVNLLSAAFVFVF